MNAGDIHARLIARFADAILAAQIEGPSPFVVVKDTALIDIAVFMKSESDLAFDNLTCLSAVDFPKETPARIEVVYHLFSYQQRHQFALKVHLPRENPSVATVEAIWPVANWHEREAFDLFGVVFTGHSDLRRILLPDDWQGHPLRKDWVDPDFYNGMHVKPTAQMADRSQAGETLGVGPFATTPPNRHRE
ncbi:MAG: NADH-quinone oxidoreductase subunit C [Vicinamibacteria bacterium]|nr:NADH-quinone oxidoreductase subunit C [Vicinamibacteria bacterium]